MKASKFCVSVLLTASVFIIFDAPRSHSGSLSEGIWVEQTIVFHLGDLSGSSGFWRGIFEEAADRWNDVWVNKRITTTRDSIGAPFCSSEGTQNKVYFLSTMCGVPWGDAIAVTPIVLNGNTVQAADIVFNSNVIWGAYDGVAIPGVNDFRRVAVHEIGHALGLNHETVEPSIMTERPSDLYLPQFDDIDTLATRYGIKTANLRLEIVGSGTILVEPAVDGTSVLIDNSTISSNYGEFLNCNQPSCEYILQDGLRLRLQAIPANGESFVRFEGSNRSDSIIGLAPLLGERTLRAIFSDSSSEGGGSGGAIGPLPFDYGDYVLSRTPNGVLVFDKLGGDAIGVINQSIQNTLSFRDQTINLSDTGYWGRFTAPAGKFVNGVEVSQQVYRFFNTRDNAFFYTANVEERDLVLDRSSVNRNNVDEWPYAFQGSTFSAATSYNGAVPLYRFYNFRTGHHFYTASQAEVEFVNAKIANENWPFLAEGVAFFVYDKDPLPTSKEFEIPVFRLYSPSLDRHFFTGSNQEYKQMLDTGIWNDEGIGFWAEWYLGTEP